MSTGAPPKGARPDAADTCFRGLSLARSASGLDLAARAGRADAAAAILPTLSALPPPARQAALDKAAAHWQPRACRPRGACSSSAARCSACSSDDRGVLVLLLQAGANPFLLLPRLLLRYERSIQVEHRQPFYEQANGYRNALEAVLSSQPIQAAVQAAGWTLEQHAQLLLAAVFCRDGLLCRRLVAAASEACWVRHAANCRLLVAAAEHDLPGVLAALLAVRTRSGEQPFAVAAPAGAAGIAAAGAGAGMAHEGCTPLMAAAERNSCAALRLLLSEGAAVNALDEDGVSALHWAVIGGALEAAQLLLEAGASPDQPCAAQPDGLHLERPLLTAVKEGHCRLARLLLAHGASLAAPAESGTPLSVALACAQAEAARQLLDLGADAQQSMPPALAGGRFRDASLPTGGQAAQQGAAAGPPPPPSYASLLGLAASRRQQAAPLLELLLAAGADPAAVCATADAPGHADLPLAEAAAAGSVQGCATLLRWAQRRGMPLATLGWAAAAEAAARRCLASDAHHELLCQLLAAWQQQPREQQAAVPSAARAAIVAALLQAHTQQQQAALAAGQEPDAGCELQAVLLAEHLSDLGICADVAASLAAAPHNRAVALAALPAAQRWSPHTHRLFPPAFKATVRQLLLAAARQQHEAQAELALGLPAGTAGGLGSLPDHLLHCAIQLASGSLSYWLSYSHHC